MDRLQDSENYEQMECDDFFKGVGVDGTIDGNHYMERVIGATEWKQDHASKVPNTMSPDITKEEHSR